MKGKMGVMLLILGAGVLLSGCGKKEGAVPAGPLSISIPAVLPADIERDVMAQAEPKMAVQNWEKYKNKVVAWTGTVIAPDEFDIKAVSGDPAYSGKILVVVQVNALKVLVPSTVAFAPGANVFFMASLNAFSGSTTSAAGQKIFLNAEGLEIKIL